MKINKRKIARILETMGKELIGDESVITKDGNSIDIEKFNLHPVKIKAVIALKEVGVKDNKHLSSLGFIPASMIMRF